MSKDKKMKVSREELNNIVTSMFKEFLANSEKNFTFQRKLDDGTVIDVTSEVADNMDLWFDKNFREKINEMLKSCDTLINEQEKRLKKLEKQMAQITMEISNLGDKCKGMDHDLRKFSHKMQDVTYLKKDLSRTQKDIKKLKHRTKSVKNTFLKLCYCVQLASPGSSLKKISKNIDKRLEKPDNYISYSSRNNRNYIIDGNYTEVKRKERDI